MGANYLRGRELIPAEKDWLEDAWGTNVKKAMGLLAEAISRIGDYILDIPKH